ncbi:MAG: glutathionylspermidine synthase family protein [Telmatospirillum sp.]|nr:glutathionylspermidine synthase family protein [Telmatospirillum sp.]
MQWIAPASPDISGGIARSLGLDPAYDDGAVYIDPREAVLFDKAEIDALYDASAELERLCLELVERVVADEDYARFGLSDLAARMVAQSWRQGQRNLVGRFDLAFVPGSAPKLIEYNAETPVMLVEAATFQAAWHKRHFPNDLQWNEIEARLVAAWGAMGLARLPVHFAGAAGDGDAALTLDLLAKCAEAAGFATKRLDIEAIGWDGEKFLDGEDAPIRTLFKLYPWSWMLADAFGAHMADAEILTIEPAWKMLLADKRMLAALWEMFPNHPNLLQASLEPSDIGGPAVAKPALGRNGDGVKLFANGLDAAQTGGDAEPADTRDGPVVLQKMAPLGTLGATQLLASTWMVASQPAGLAVRGAEAELVGARARFIPHIVR